MRRRFYTSYNETKYKEELLWDGNDMVFVRLVWEAFGTWLVERLRENDLTVQQFADMLKCTRASVHSHIKMKQHPSYITVTAYCYYLNASPLDVWKLVEEDWGE